MHTPGRSCCHFTKGEKFDKKKCLPCNFFFLCVCWGFTAQPTPWSHVKHSQFIWPQVYWAGLIWGLFLTLVLLNPDIHCLCKQCRSRTVGFWRRDKRRTIHMKSQALFSLKNKKKFKGSSAVVVISALRVNICTAWPRLWWHVDWAFYCVCVQPCVCVLCPAYANYEWVRSFNHSGLVAVLWIGCYSPI